MATAQSHPESPEPCTHSRTGTDCIPV
jgi:hypothetical protein